MISFTLDELKKITSGYPVQVGERQAFQGVTIDSRSVGGGNIFLAVKGVNHDGHAFVDQAVEKGAAALIVSKKVDAPGDVCVIRVSDTTKALGQLAAFHRLRFDYPVIAVTGSAGKTTTKEMIFSVLKTRYRVLKNKGSFNNQWGVPLTLLQMNEKHQAAVLELGTNNPGEIAALSRMVSPDIAVLTNVGPCHLQGLKTVEDVYREKKSVTAGIRSQGGVIFNHDDRFLKRLKRLKKYRLCSYGLTPEADFFADQISRDGRVLSFRINQRYKVSLRTPVQENISNALAAAACGRLLGVSFQAISKGLHHVSFRQHRQEIQRLAGFTLINDSYNANPISFKSALNTLVNFPSKGKKILVCADMLELGKEAVSLHRELAEHDALSEVNLVLALGIRMKHFIKQLGQRPRAIEAKYFNEIGDLNKELGKAVSRGDVVLVKGSRGMRMERSVEFLEKKFL